MSNTYVVTCKSESGDSYGPYLFATEPTDEKLEAFFREECPCEFEEGDGPGDWGSYLYVHVNKVEVMP